MPAPTYLDTYAASPDVNAPKFDEAGRNQVRSIENAWQALQIARRLERDDYQRDFRRARNLAAFNGAPPYDPQELISKAQGYRYNVSFGFMEGTIGRAVVPYNQLTKDINTLAFIEADLPNEKLTLIRDEFSRSIKEWGKWSKFISRLNQELVLNGYCVAIFPSDFNPWPVFIPQKETFVHEASPNDIEDLELFCWKKYYLIHELYKHIENPEIAERAGWNVDNVRQALMQATPLDIWQRSTSVTGTWSAIESAIRAGTLYPAIMGAKVIHTYHVFAAELDGKVTHYICLDQPTPDGVTQPARVELFKREDRFQAFKDFLVYFDLEAGDGRWHGSRGLGQRTYNTHSAIDKLRNAMMDQAFASGLTLLQLGDQISQENFEFAVMGPFAIIPSGIQINATQIPAISAQTFQADALLSATSEQRIGDIVPTTLSPITGARKTATESRIVAGRQEIISRDNLQRYLDPLSQLLSIIVRRLLNPNSPNKFAKDFQQSLLRNGFTSQELSQIRGARSTGRIDDVMGETVLNTGVVFGEFRGDPDVDQVELKRRRIASVLGAKEVEGLLITDQDQTRIIESQRQQRIEIASIIDGIPMPVSPRDNHMIHFQVSMDWLMGQIQTQMTGGPGADPSTLAEMVNHAASHLSQLKDDPLMKPRFKESKQQLDQIAKIVEQVITQQQQQLEAQISQAQRSAPGGAPATLPPGVIPAAAVPAIAPAPAPVATSTLL